MKQILLQKSEVSLMDEGILHIHLKSGTDIHLSDAILIVEAMDKLGGGKKFPVLMDAGDFVTIDQEVRVFSASEDSNLFTLADAIAYYSLGQKLIANFYLNQNKPVVPTQVFPDKDKAVEWLKTFIKK
jgi:hypothetical protein